MAFEYRYRIWVDEEIISRYPPRRGIKYFFETRTNFRVKRRIDIDGEERIIDSERYALKTTGLHEEKRHIEHCMGLRLKDYWMPDEVIKRLIDELMIVAEEEVVAGGPLAVDVDVCTVQEEGEGVEATSDRAMRPEYLPPLLMYPIDCSGNAWYKPLPAGYSFNLEYFLRGDLGSAAVRVEDVEKGLEVMQVCRVCGREPMVGTKLSRLRCGDVFHYHCIVRCLQKDILCPVCRHPARDEPIRGPGINFDGADFSGYNSPDE